jgi:uncharacterized membrane protein YadS
MKRVLILLIAGSVISGAAAIAAMAMPYATEKTGK